MSALLLVLAVAAAVSRRFDAFAVALIGQVVYFIPSVYWADTEPPTHAYYIWWMVLLTTIVCAALSSRMQQHARFRFADRSTEATVFFQMSTAVTLLAFAYMFGSAGLLGFVNAKYGPVPGGSSVLYYFWVTTLSYSSLYALSRRSRAVLVLNLCQFAILIASGDRTHVVMLALAAALLAVRMSGRGSALGFIKTSPIRSVALVIGVVTLGLYGKLMYAGILQYATTEKDSRVTGQLVLAAATATPQSLLLATEPYHTQSILVSAIETGFTLPASTITQLPLNLLPYSSKLGVDVHETSDVIKERFFPSWGEQSGVGGNFWAEAYMIGGLALVAVYVLCYCAILWGLNGLIVRASDSLIAPAALAAAYVGFYVHRNTSSQMVAHGKRLVIVTMAIAIVSHAVVRWAEQLKNPESSH